MVKNIKNKDKYNLAHLHIVERAEETILGSNITYVEIKYDGKIVKEYAYTNAAGIKKFLEWLEEEYKPSILDDVENAYLSAVIKPFRKRIKYIEKIDHSNVKNDQYLCIALANDRCVLPNFKKGTMYKGMEEGREYTLEELGL